MQQEIISIIIPCFNDAEYIEQAINSALVQSWPKKEVIVVDDGSHTDTKIKLKSLEPRINRLITQENKGVSAARNEGIKVAKGEYILVLDSDDYFEPKFCEKAIDVLLKDTDVKLVTCYSNWFSKGNNKLFKPSGGQLEDILLKNIAMGSSMFRKSDWKAVGGYDEIMLKGFEDWEFYIRLLKNGGYAYVIPEMLFNYRNKQNSRNKKANLAMYAIKEYIYNKHAELYKEHFSLFIHEWLKSTKKNEAFKQQVMDSVDYKIGNKLLKPLRALGMFKKK
ncbi:hypothetical protein APR41_12055 [Salegentibacter salinarum]|uniref:Glycosyl transferase family 2 n=1 Tax=Salegentibacter salinarum TaxID=447422 RepID=A0A2N0U2A6_9FLAO|nr:glycosyltransferase family A protein [Salegentibacter salinarum]PKD21142.1 hypothetical protein APR41_12055 [Salegentibacter salinarum]SKB76382.1 hypothetical protein SAMN05660903_02458 [Salegentibacter salinarum]